MGNSRVVMPMVYCIYTMGYCIYTMGYCIYTMGYCIYTMQGGEAGQGKQGVQWAGSEERAAGHCL
jgi:hypothetical protein